MKNRIIFICVHNAGRSQIAQAFFNQLVPNDLNWYAESAGVEPSDKINPTVIKVMKESGIDISSEKPKRLDFCTINTDDRLIGMGCDIHDSCPINLQDSIDDWELEDPHNQNIWKIKEIRDIIKDKVQSLIEELVNN